MLHWPMTTKDKPAGPAPARQRTRLWLPLAILYGVALLLGFFAKLHG